MSKPNGFNYFSTRLKHLVNQKMDFDGLLYPHPLLISAITKRDAFYAQIFDILETYNESTKQLNDILEPWSWDQKIIEQFNRKIKSDAVHEALVQRHERLHILKQELSEVMRKHAKQYVRQQKQIQKYKKLLKTAEQTKILNKDMEGQIDDVETKIMSHIDFKTAQMLSDKLDSLITYPKIFLSKNNLDSGGTSDVSKTFINTDLMCKGTGSKSDTVISITSSQLPLLSQSTLPKVRKKYESKDVPLKKVAITPEATHSKEEVHIMGRIPFTKEQLVGEKYYQEKTKDSSQKLPKYEQPLIVYKFSEKETAVTKPVTGKKDDAASSFFDTGTSKKSLIPTMEGKPKGVTIVETMKVPVVATFSDLAKKTTGEEEKDRSVPEVAFTEKQVAFMPVFPKSSLVPSVSQKPISKKATLFVNSKTKTKSLVLQTAEDNKFLKKLESSHHIKSVFPDDVKSTTETFFKRSKTHEIKPRITPSLKKSFSLSPIIKSQTTPISHVSPSLSKHLKQRHSSKILKEPTTKNALEIKVERRKPSVQLPTKKGSAIMQVSKTLQTSEKSPIVHGSVNTSKTLVRVQPSIKDSRIVYKNLSQRYPQSLPTEPDLRELTPKIPHVKHSLEKPQNTTFLKYKSVVAPIKEKIVSTTIKKPLTSIPSIRLTTASGYQKDIIASQRSK